MVQILLMGISEKNVQGDLVKLPFGLNVYNLECPFFVVYDPFC